MRKAILTVILIIAGLYTKAQITFTRNSVIVYAFKDFSVILVSRSLTDSSLQSPARERAVTVAGHYLEVFLTPNKDPFLHPVNKVEFDAGSTAIEHLEMRYTHYSEGKDYGNWIDVKSRPLVDTNSNISFFPQTPEKLPVAKGDYYILRESLLTPYSLTIIEIRNKRTKEELIRFRLNGQGTPVYPSLKLATQNTAEKKLIDSLLSQRFYPGTTQEVIEQLKPKRPYVPPASDKRRILENENLYQSSEYVLFFEKQRQHYPDSSLEFRLFSETNKDTAWIKTGHRVDILDLEPGDHYKLQIRYELFPYLIQEHTFYVVPKWYQTTQTKIIFAGLLIVTALLAGLLIYRRRSIKSKRRREQLSLEIKSIRSQLNPHFIFNALSSIQGLINKHDIAAANRYLTEFSSLLRESLHNHEKEMVPLVTEINLLETYLRLEQLRFDFKYTINIDQAINKNATEIPNLILQPLVENAVKHGVSTLGEKGLIKIDFIKREHDLLVLIADNGNQFDETWATDGFGLKLTKNRISLLSQTLKEQPIKLTIERRQGMETIVNLVFTNWI
jgi:two-component sensor histidine kinase